MRWLRRPAFRPGNEYDGKLQYEIDVTIKVSKSLRMLLPGSAEILDNWTVWMVDIDTRARQRGLSRSNNDRASTPATEINHGDRSTDKRSCGGVTLYLL